MNAARTLATLVLTLAVGSVGPARGQEPPGQRDDPQADALRPPPPPPGIDPPPDEGRAAEIREIERSRLEFVRPFIPGAVDLDPVRAAGLPVGAEPFRLTARRAYALASIRARTPEVFGEDRLDMLARFDELADRAKGNDFGQFRAEFIEGPERNSFLDPGSAYFEALGSLGLAERALASLAAQEQASEVVTMSARGGMASGVSQMDVDRSDLTRESARREAESAMRRHRDALDRLRVRLGLPPDAPVVLDGEELEPFRRVFREIDDWRIGAVPEPSDLIPILLRLPALADLTIGEVSISTLDEKLESTELALQAAEDRRRQAGGQRGPEGDEEALRVRQLVRELIDLRRDYRQAGDRLHIMARSANDLAQGLMSPPFEDPARPGAVVEAVRGLVLAGADIRAAEADLVRTWAEYHGLRLELLRALELSPGDDWDAFLGLSEVGGDGRP